jgi:hypothetical protein
MYTACEAARVFRLVPVSCSARLATINREAAKQGGEAK